MNSPKSLEWEYTIPFFSWYVMRIFVVFFTAPIILFAAIILLSEGVRDIRFEQFTPDIYYAGLLFLIFIFLSLVVTFLIFKDGFNYKYIVNQKGVYQITGSREKKINRLAVIIGILGKSATTTGAGLLSYSGEERFISWKEAKVININHKKRYIHFSRGRIAIGPIGMFCTPQNFKDVTLLIENYKS
jgi:hypothetical protein